MFRNVTDMERMARGEADHTANARIKGGWLRVFYNTAINRYSYWHDHGRSHTALTRLQLNAKLTEATANH